MSSNGFTLRIKITMFKDFNFTVCTSCPVTVDMPFCYRTHAPITEAVPLFYEKCNTNASAHSLQVLHILHTD